MVVRSLAEHSAQVLEQLADRHGVPFELVEGFLYPGHSVMRMHCTPRRTGEELMGALLQACEKASLDILTECTVRHLLVDEHDLAWDHAWRLCQRVFSYTNHTLMHEALETWPVDMLGRVLPRHLRMIFDINADFLADLFQRCHLVAPQAKAA